MSVAYSELTSKQKDVLDERRSVHRKSNKGVFLNQGGTVAVNSQGRGFTPDPSVATLTTKSRLATSGAHCRFFLCGRLTHVEAPKEGEEPENSGECFKDDNGNVVRLEGKRSWEAIPYEGEGAEPGDTVEGYYLLNMVSRTHDIMQANIIMYTLGQLKEQEPGLHCMLEAEMGHLPLKHLDTRIIGVSDVRATKGKLLQYFVDPWVLRYPTRVERPKVAETTAGSGSRKRARDDSVQSFWSAKMARAARKLGPHNKAPVPRSSVESSEDWGDESSDDAGSEPEVFKGTPGDFSERMMGRALKTVSKMGELIQGTLAVCDLDRQSAKEDREAAAEARRAAALAHEVTSLDRDNFMEFMKKAEMERQTAYLQHWDLVRTVHAQGLELVRTAIAGEGVTMRALWKDILLTRVNLPDSAEDSGSVPEDSVAAEGTSRGKVNAPAVKPVLAGGYSPEVADYDSVPSEGESL